MFSGFGEHPGHSDLFRNHSRPHLNSSTLELDLDVDAGSEVELHQRVHGLRGRVDDIQEALVRAHLELFAALLIDVRRTVHRELLDTRRQRNRPTDLRTGALSRVHDLARRRIEDAVIERLEPDPDILAVHLIFSRWSCPTLLLDIHDFYSACSRYDGRGLAPAIACSLLEDRK